MSKGECMTRSLVRDLLGKEDRSRSGQAADGQAADRNYPLTIYRLVQSRIVDVALGQPLLDLLPDHPLLPSFETPPHEPHDQLLVLLDLWRSVYLSLCQIDHTQPRQEEGSPGQNRISSESAAHRIRWTLTSLIVSVPLAYVSRVSSRRVLHADDLSSM